MDLNVNVNGTVKVVLDAAFDVEKLAAMLAGALASPAEQRDEEKPAKKPRAAKAAKAEPAEPVAAEPAAAPEPKKDEAPAKEPLSEEEVTALRKAVADFIHADEGNKTKVKDWLTAHHLSRVPDITKDLLAEFNAFVGAE
ncbi:hypothetical protein [uncultured Megasphaera sp.]|uniref:hypothetical protein n=1 Tax=uncultured Megasphaera sp. TaxID=165188 RepID=UPI00265CB769|nr:hypothetical protein [uncultured Megasphaera sp.]